MVNILLLMGWQNEFNSAKYNTAKGCTKMYIISFQNVFYVSR